MHFLHAFMLKLFGMHVALVSGECLSDGRVCLEDEMLLLLQLKSTLKFNADASNKLVSWNQSADCCSWGGISWDATGHVVALDLSSEFISGGFYSSSSIFSLQYLQSLNLANNTFFSSEIPSGFDKLGNLTYLNLSKAGFSGQIPIEISRLTRLVTIDISSFNYLFETPTLKLEQPNLRMLVQNLKELRKLYLNGVDISAPGNEWCQALSSSVPNLRVLSLSWCFLLGPIDSSMVPTLQILDLSDNQLLWGALPEFPQTRCNFSGPIPSFIENLTRLFYLDLSSNGFTSSIPSFHSSKNLTHINLSSLLNLVNLDLHHNLLHGGLPLSIFSHLSLQNIWLSNNQFSSQLNEFSVVANSLSVFDLRALHVLELSFNNLSGTLELSKFQELGNLTTLSLSHNKLSINVDESICNATFLQVLDLSDNALSGGIPSCLIENEALAVLNLRRNMTIPESVANCKGLEVLNLGNNYIDDNFPCWLKNISSLRVLVLRANRFHGTIGCPNRNSTWPMLQIVDLADNNFSEFSELYYQDAVTVTSKGQEMELVKVLTLFTSIDFSFNKFEGQIPEEMGNFISLYVLNLSAETARVIRPLTQPSEWEDPHRACEPNFPFSPGPLLQSVSGAIPSGDGGNATTNVLIEFFQGFSITKTKEQVVEEEGFSYQSESISISEKVVYLGLISINFW
ncbi:hypothetical protein AAG906_025596 [Vitis piasezkii]